ncbi:MAG: endolytic transglycosylase MltG [Oscillospiraceae bacterium]|nr:endolytic transglycosylase MltG [Oscillospiraceae bacterium]
MSERKNSGTTSWDAAQVRRETSRKPEEKKVKPKKKRRGGWLLYLLGVLVSSALLAGIGWLMVNDVCALNKEPLTATVVVEKGDGVGVVTDKLKDAGLINSKLLFRIFGIVFDAGDTITPGTYELNTDMDFRCLIQSMQSSLSITPVGVVTVTIPEGYNAKQIFKLLEEKGVCSAADLEEAAKNYEFTEFDFVDNENLGDITRLEGYLAPDTYEFFEDEAPEKAISRLLRNFDFWMNDDMMAAVEKSGRSLQEIVTIASLIEKETDGTDREKIASVIYNRLNYAAETAYFLQIDAALVYAAGREITVDDYQTLDSPYNLYRHQGLPPTAIANPGLASLKAALNPASTNFYFYALGKDGLHIFSRTLAEHNRVLANN